MSVVDAVAKELTPLIVEIGERYVKTHGGDEDVEFTLS